MLVMGSFLTIVPREFLHHGLAAVDIPHVNATILRARNDALVAIEAGGHRVSTILMPPAIPSGVRIVTSTIRTEGASPPLPRRSLILFTVQKYYQILE